MWSELLACNTDKPICRLVLMKLQRDMGSLLIVDHNYKLPSRITRLQQPAGTISSSDRNELRGESCGICLPANGGTTCGCPRCCAKAFKTSSDIACPITEASVADHKMVPDLSHAKTHTHTDLLFRVKMLPVNLHLSCEHYSWGRTQGTNGRAAGFFRGLGRDEYRLFWCGGCEVHKDDWR